VLLPCEGREEARLQEKGWCTWMPVLGWVVLYATLKSYNRGSLGHLLVVETHQDNKVLGSRNMDLANVCSPP
jgi:hypothetical protein